MLTIRPEQMRAFEEAQFARFVRELTRCIVDLGMELDRPVTEAEAEQLVRGGIERAPGYRLETEGEISVYVICAFAMGEERMLADPATGSILLNSALPGRTTAEMLVTALEDFERQQQIAGGLSKAATAENG